METLPTRDDYQVAIICALGTESEAIEAIFDEIYDTSTRPWQKAKGDENTYTTGRIGRHYVVLAYLPGMGKVKAAKCASSMCMTFGNIKLALVAGVCGGAPFTPDRSHIYLGDVVISTQVVQADFGREHVDGFVPKTAAEGNIGLPPAAIRSFLHKLQNRKTISGLEERMKAYTNAGLEYAGSEFPLMNTDMTIFFLHNTFTSTTRQSLAGNVSHAKAIILYDRERSREIIAGPSAFFGPICSTDSIKKNRITRDQYAETHAVLAFEMEGAGVYEIVPTLIIKGVCDYADSHKNKTWQGYAAITAASCCKATLEEWDAHSIRVPHHAKPKVRKDKDAGKKTKQDYLNSLDFPQLNSRFVNIKLAHPRTCQWIFESIEFQSWISRDTAELHNRILWIRGKPGSGKSTLIKHIFQSREQFFPKYTHASYFFHARGTELQKTRIGMLRSLLCQLLADDEKLMEMFISIQPSRSVGAIENRTWSLEELESFLLLSAREGWLGNSLLLVDALDECEVTEARHIAIFLEDLANNAVHKRSLLYVCISIRYFPNIGVKKCVQLNLDERVEHVSDLDRYIADKLRIKEQAITDQLSKKANHVFLWAVLVVQSLNAAYDEGADSDSLRDLLLDIPEELNEIFERLLGPAEAIPPWTLVMLQLVLFSLRPLDIRTLYLLVIARTKPQKLRAWSESGMTTDRAQSYIITASRGLLEIVRTSTKVGDNSQIVQFIHESVRDYLYHDLQPSKNLNSADFHEHCHEEISWACVNSLATLNTDYSLGNILNLDDWPNGVYGMEYALNHIEEVLDSGKLRDLLRKYSISFIDPSQLSAPATSTFPGDALLRSVISLAPSPSHRLRGILSGVNRKKLLIGILEDTEALSMNKQQGKLLYEEALKNAVLADWVEGVEILLKYGAEFALDRDYHDNVLQLSMRHCYRRPSRILKLEPMVRALISVISTDSGQSINVCPVGGMIPLVVASKYGSKDLVSLILEVGADTEVKDLQHGYALDAAVENKRQDVVELLLARGADPEQSLDLAVETADQNIVWQLLEKGADPNGSVNSSTTILMRAVELGDIEIVRLLLSHKADPKFRNARGNSDAWNAIENFTLDLVGYRSNDVYQERYANFEELKSSVEHDVREQILSLFNQVVDREEHENAPSLPVYIPGRVLDKQQARESLGTKHVPPSGPHSSFMDIDFWRQS